MKMSGTSIIRLISFTAIMFCGASCAGVNVTASVKTVVLGSTPGDPSVKSMLSIPADKPIDFIRWELTLSEQKNNAGSFSLNLTFGEGKPNTSGFKGGGEKLSVNGSYKARLHRNNLVYDLEGEHRGVRFSLVRLNTDMFHLLSPANELMVGNGGWSYTLAREKTSEAKTDDLPMWFDGSRSVAANEVVFDGRTPCREFAVAYNMSAGLECHKLKWKLTLYRDPETKQPTVYKLQHSLIDHKVVEGKWAELQGTSRPTIYKLDPNRSEGSVSFLVGDYNVLFLLDRNMRLLVGNEHFAYTLNRRVNRYVEIRKY